MAGQAFLISYGRSFVEYHYLLSQVLVTLCLSSNCTGLTQLIDMLMVYTHRQLMVRVQYCLESLHQ